MEIGDDVFLLRFGVGLGDLLFTTCVLATAFVWPCIPLGQISAQALSANMKLAHNFICMIRRIVID